MFVSRPADGFDYAMVSFDSAGVERSDDPDGGTFSRTILADLARKEVSDLFIMIHGWRGDLLSAQEQFGRWFGALHQRLDAVERSRSYFLGIHWPSQPWGKENFDVSFSPHAAGALAAFADDPVALSLAERLLQNARDLTSANGDWRLDAIALADHLGSKGDVSGAPGADGPRITEETFEDLGSFGANSSALHPLNVLGTLSFWSMKSRARSVGESGVHNLLSGLLRDNPQLRVHVMGHSLGTIVASAAVGGPSGRAALPRPISSLALIQGALSLWAYSPQIAIAGNKPGYFKDILSPGKVSGCVITTRSEHDLVVGIAYKASALIDRSIDFGSKQKLPQFGGIGTWGIQGLPEAPDFFPSEDIEMAESGHPYRLRANRLYNFESSAFISGHNDIDGAEVAHAIRSAAQT